MRGGEEPGRAMSLVPKAADISGQKVLLTI
jgi:hypothetical protein